MTKPVSLESKIEIFRDAINYGWDFGDYRDGIPDVRVMERLGCTPQSWSRYRPQLIQYCRYNHLVKTEEIDGISVETIRFNMRYDKKKKMWYGKREKLMYEPKKGYGWEYMTPEDLARFDILWTAEEDFMY